MTKREAIWIVIRLAGLWFFWHSLETALSIFSTYALANSEGLIVPGSSRMFVWPALSMVLYLAIGLYCLAGGGMIFNVLNREPDDNVQGGFPGSGTIS